LHTKADILSQFVGHTKNANKISRASKPNYFPLAGYLIYGKFELIID